MWCSVWWGLSHISRCRILWVLGSGRIIINLKKEKKLSNKPIPLPLSPSWISHETTWDLMQGSTLRCQCLMAWIMAWPLLFYKTAWLVLSTWLTWLWVHISRLTLFKYSLEYCIVLYLLYSGRSSHRWETSSQTVWILFCLLNKLFGW
jgi:hypothetical protein